MRLCSVDLTFPYHLSFRVTVQTELQDIGGHPQGLTPGTTPEEPRRRSLDRCLKLMASKGGVSRSQGLPKTHRTHRPRPQPRTRPQHPASAFLTTPQSRSRAAGASRAGPGVASLGSSPVRGPGRRRPVPGRSESRRPHWSPLQAEETRAPLPPPPWPRPLQAAASAPPLSPPRACSLLKPGATPQAPPSPPRGQGAGRLHDAPAEHGGRVQSSGWGRIPGTYIFPPPRRSSLFSASEARRGSGVRIRVKERSSARSDDVEPLGQWARARVLKGKACLGRDASGAYSGGRPGSPGGPARLVRGHQAGGSLGCEGYFVKQLLAGAEGVKAAAGRPSPCACAPGGLRAWWRPGSLGARPGCYVEVPGSPAAKFEGVHRCCTLWRLAVGTRRAGGGFTSEAVADGSCGAAHGVRGDAAGAKILCRRNCTRTRQRVVQQNRRGCRRRSGRQCAEGDAPPRR